MGKGCKHPKSSAPTATHTSEPRHKGLKDTASGRQRHKTPTRNHVVEKAWKRKPFQVNKLLKLAHEDFINWETINEKTSKGNDFNDIGRAHHPQYTKKDCYEEVIMHTHIGGEGNKIIR